MGHALQASLGARGHRTRGGNPLQWHRSGLGGQWNEPGPDVWCSVTRGQQGREKTVLVRNWSDNDGLQMDYGEEQSQEDAK